MKVSEAYPSRYLKAANLDGDGPIVTIKSVAIEELGSNGDKKPVAYFKEMEKGLVLNRTNAETIALFTHEDDMEAWIGYRIGLTPRRSSSKASSSPHR